MIPEQRRAHKCMDVYFTHCIAPTCSGYTWGHPQGDALQGIDISRYYRTFWNQYTGVKVLSFKIRWFKIHA